MQHANPIPAAGEQASGPSAPRKRPTPRYHFDPGFELSPLDFTKARAEILNLFAISDTVVAEKTGRSFFSDLINATDAYRDALLQQAHDASRAEDREADRRFVKLARQLIARVDLLSEDERRLLNTIVPALPRFSRRRRVDLMSAVGRATILMVDRLSALESPSANIAAFAEILSKLPQLFDAFWNARAHPMVVSSSMVRWPSTRALGLTRYMRSLDYIARCSEAVADQLRPIRGPDRNISIFCFLLELDPLLLEYRGHGLRQLHGWIRSDAEITLGDDMDCKSTDELAVMKLVEIVCRSVPDHLKSRLRPYFFSPGVVAEALKIHITARNAARPAS